MKKLLAVTVASLALAASTAAYADPVQDRVDGPPGPFAGGAADWILPLFIGGAIGAIIATVAEHHTNHVTSVGPSTSP
jgi:hypothetical protein